MYRVLCDGLTLYNDRLENLQILNPSVELEENKTGSFVFTLPADHPYYGRVRKLKSIITVYQDDYLLFRGRVLDEETGWHNEKHISCEGELAFLLDSIQRPYEYSGTVAGYLNLLIDRHNEQVEENKRFTVGKITVTDSNDYIVRSNIDYTDTWTELQDKTVKLMGGYVSVRHEEDTNYLDYLQDSTTLSPQAVTFGKNLLDLKLIRKGADIATAVIPLGAKLKDTDTRLTVESVNDGSDTIADDEAIAQYGRIVKTVIFDDVTEATNLLTKGKAHLAQLVKLPETIELTAADLATVDTSFSSFHLGTQVRVTSGPHGIGQFFRVSKLSVNLLDPAANKLTLGGTVSTFTSSIGIIKEAQAPPGADGHDGEDATVLRIDSTRGTVFKNSAVSTTLTVAIYHGALRITDKEALLAAFGSGAYLEWSWQRMEDNAFGLISASDSRIQNDGFSLVLTPDDIDTKATFQCKLMI